MSLESRVAVLESELSTLKTLAATIQTDVRMTRDAVLQAKGGWKVLMMIGGASGVAGAFVSKWIPVIFSSIAK